MPFFSLSFVVCVCGTVCGIRYKRNAGVQKCESIALRGGTQDAACFSSRYFVTTDPTNPPVPVHPPDLTELYVRS